MSQVEFCRFWCLLDREGENVFAVQAHLEWKVEQLAAAIREK